MSSTSKSQRKGKPKKQLESQSPRELEKERAKDDRDDKSKQEEGEVTQSSEEIEKKAKLERKRRRRYIKTFSNALPEKLFAALESVPHVPNEEKKYNAKEAHWMPCLSTENGERKMASPRTMTEQVVQYIASHVLPKKWVPNLKGAEWWSHSRPVSGEKAKMHFHFDRDELLWEQKGLMVHPTVSSIFYITDYGGPTVVVAQECDEKHTELLPPRPTRAYVIQPTRNCFATFSGAQLHGVITPARALARLRKAIPSLSTMEALNSSSDPQLSSGRSSSQKRRITLLINWWESDITGAEMLRGGPDGRLSQNDLWAYGKPLQSPLWAAKNKRTREDDTMMVKEKSLIQHLYSYDLSAAQSTSEEDDQEGEGDCCDNDEGDQDE